MKTFLLFFYVVVFAFIVRIWAVDRNPVSLYWDEVAIGYNAWSILQTGKDEYGRSFPVLFESFNEFKLPGYIYSAVPSIALFGPNSLGVRFPSVIYGTLTVLALYWLILGLFGKKTLAMMSAATLTIMPWHVHMSRVGFEATGMLFWVVFGLALLVYAKKHPLFLLLGLPVFGVSMYFYHAARLFVPIFLLTQFIIDWRWWWKQYRLTILGLFLTGVLLLPLGIETIRPGRIVRFDQVSIFSDPTVLEPSIKRIQESEGSFPSRIANHRFVIWSLTVIKGELAHFSPQFLLQSGDANARHSVSGFGMLFAVSAPLLILGIIRTIHLKDVRGVLFSWLIIAPFPGAIALPLPHGLRSILLAPVLAVLVGLGIEEVLRWTRRRMRVAGSLLILLAFLGSFIFYADRYLRDYPLLSAGAWADGYQELFTWLRTNGEKVDRIAVTGYHWKPYIFAAFYLPFEPAKYLSVPTNHSGFGKFFFGPSPWDQGDPYYNPEFSWEEVLKQPGTLTVLAPDEGGRFPLGRFIRDVKRADGSTAFVVRLVEKKP